MEDAFGIPQRVVVLGGTSTIGLAIAAEFVREGTARVDLCGREREGLVAAGQVFEDAGTAVTCRTFDARATGSHEAFVSELFQDGDVDLVVAAFGVLGNQERAEEDASEALRIVETNFVGVVSVLTSLARGMRVQGHGAVVVLSTVAGERVRRSNYVYGSSKAGLDGFALGLGEALGGTGVHLLVVRPGFVHTKMTQGLSPAPLAVAPDIVARAVVQGLRRRRELIWVPSSLRWVMAVLRHLPRRVFRRLPV